MAVVLDEHASLRLELGERDREPFHAT
jgi:hypothetical protein